MIHRNWRSTRYHWTDFSVLKMFLRIIFFPLRFIPMYCYSLRSINSQEATKKTTASTQFVRYVAMLQEQCFIRCTCFTCSERLQCEVCTRSIYCQHQIQFQLHTNKTNKLKQKKNNRCAVDFGLFLVMFSANPCTFVACTIKKNIFNSYKKRKCFGFGMFGKSTYTIDSQALLLISAIPNNSKTTPCEKIITVSSLIKWLICCQLTMELNTMKRKKVLTNTAVKLLQRPIASNERR